MFYNLQMFSIAVATVKISSAVKRKKITDLSGVLVLNWDNMFFLKKNFDEDKPS